MTTHAFAPRFDAFAPFAPATEQAPAAAADAEPSYVLVASQPAVDSDEIESTSEAAEITVRWGTQQLDVRECAGTFVIGEGADYELPASALGVARHALVTRRPDGRFCAVPAGATVKMISARGEEDLASLVARGAATVDGEIALTLGAHVEITLPGSVTFEVRGVRQGKRIAPAGFLSRIANGANGHLGLSALGHAAIVAALAFFVPSMAADDSEGISRDQILLMQKYMNASAERVEETPTPLPGEGSSEAPKGGGTGEPHKGESGAAGTPNTARTEGRYAIKGDSRDPRIQRKQDLEDAAHGGMIGLLAAMAPDPNAPSSPWSQDEARGSDPKSAMGSMWGSSINDAFGSGLGLEGTGEGGGGKGEGVGLDHVNTAGHGKGGLPGGWGIGKDKDGIGNGHSPTGGGHAARAPSLRPQPLTTSNGRIPAEIIQRQVRLRHGMFRACYEPALRTNPALTGRVVTKFVIGRDGSVSVAQDGGSDLPDRNVVSCVVRAFHGLSFPAPEGGQVHVVYPIMFSPGE